MNASLAAALTVVMTLTLVLAPVAAPAQEPVQSFDQLNTRLKVGDTVWVTDAQGREVQGRIHSLSPDALTLGADGSKTFAAREVGAIRERRPDSLKNGALIGMGAGGAVAIVSMLTLDFEGCTVGCVAAVLGYFGGIGAGVGALVDAMIPGKKQAVYRAPGAAGASSARLSFAPVITPRHKGVAVSLSF